MELAKLIERITTEVLKQLKEEKEGLRTKKRILLWTERLEVKEQTAEKLKLPLEQLEDRIQFKGLEDLETYDAIILPKLEAGEMVHIALGIQLGETEALAAKALLLGKRIYVLQEGLVFKAHKATTAPGYYKLLQDYEERLGAYGISVVSWEGLQLDAESSQCAVQATREKALDLKERLITESRIAELFSMGYREIRVTKNAMITPLAVDFIKSKQLKILRGMEGLEKGSGL